MKRYTHFLLFLSFLVHTLTSAAQEEEIETIIQNQPIKRKYALGVTMGIGNLVARDRVISNYLYSGNNVPLGFHFEINKEQSILRLGMQFMNSPVLKTKTNDKFEYKGELGEFYPSEKDGLDFSTINTKMVSIRMTQLYILRKSESKRIQTSLGYDIKFSSFRKKFLQFEYISDLNDRVISMGFALNFKWLLHPKHSLEYDLILPVISQVKRTLYNSDSKPETISEQKFTVIKSALGFDSQLIYKFQIAERFSLKATYSFSYLQVSFPRKEQWASNQVVLGFFIHI